MKKIIVGLLLISNAGVYAVSSDDIKQAWSATKAEVQAAWLQARDWTTNQAIQVNEKLKGAVNKFKDKYDIQAVSIEDVLAWINDQLNQTVDPATRRELAQAADDFTLKVEDAWGELNGETKLSPAYIKRHAVYKARKLKRKAQDLLD